MNQRVVTLPRRKAAPKPIQAAYETVGFAERAAADALVRRAKALQVLLNASFVTGAALKLAPRLISEAEAALAELKDLLG